MNPSREERISEYLSEALKSETLFTVAEYFNMLEKQFGLTAPRNREDYRQTGLALSMKCDAYERNVDKGMPNRYPEKCLAELILKDD